MSREPALRCYNCNRPALPGDTLCRACTFPLDWGAIGDLRSLDYLKLRLEQWRRLGELDDALADRLVDEVEGNRKSLLGSIAPRPTAAPPPFVPAVPAPSAPPRPRGLRPRYRIAPQPSPRPVAPPPPPTPPPFVPSRPPEPPGPSLLDRFAEISTAKRALYAGAILLAVGVIVFLKEQLQEQLQRTSVQAALLGVFTGAALAGGVALVVRAKERTEQRLIGRGILLLGTILLPVNAWFWLRAGLIEDRGNAWVVALVMLAVSISIALGLGDRIFVALSYASALALGWLVAFKLTGGTAPGVYALVIALVSSAYVLAEYPAARWGERRGWRGFAGTFFVCGHIGAALTLFFYTSVVRFVPGELLATLRYFDGTGYSEWTGVFVALLAAVVYGYSAWRHADSRFAYLGLAAAAYSLVLALVARDDPAGAWLLACGAAALATGLAARANGASAVWSAPTRTVAATLEWLGVFASAGVAIALASGVETRWQTPVGIALVAAALAVDAAATRRAPEALPIPGLVALAVACVLRAAGVSWFATDLTLALPLVAAPFAIALLPATLDRTRVGLVGGTSLLCGILGVVCMILAAPDTSDDVQRPVALALALAAALAAHGWKATERAPRVVFFVAAGFFLEVAALLAVVTAESRLLINDRYAALLLAPLAYALFVGWIVGRQSADERRADAAAVARWWALGATAVAAYNALPLVVDSALDARAAYLFALSAALLAVVPLATAAVDRASDLAYVDGIYGVVLALAAWAGLLLGLAWQAPPGYKLFAICATAGLAPLLFAAAARALAGRVDTIARPASWFGGGLAILIAPGLASVLTPWFATTGGADRAAVLTLATLLAVYGLTAATTSALDAARLLWSVYATVVVSALAHGLLRSAPELLVAAIACAAAGGLALASGLRARGALERLRLPGILIGHAVIAVALVDALVPQVPWTPVPWRFVAVVAAVALAYTVGGAASPSGSALERTHRALAFFGALATAVAVLHALGLTTVESQSRWLALLLTAAMAAVVFALSEWARRDGVGLAHAATGLLLLVVGFDALYAPTDWTALEAFRFAACCTALYGAAACRRTPIALAASIASACAAVFALLQAGGAAASTRVVVFAAIAVALAVAAARVKERVVWARRTLANAAHVAFTLTAIVEIGGIVPRLALGNPELTGHVVALGALTASAFAIGRLLPDDGVPYTAAWRVFALATYCVVGVRLGYGLWRDSAYYTLPTGAALVALGAYASREERRVDAGIMLWLGSLLAGAPPFLHALQNRFVLDDSPVGYDVLTIAVGLALGLASVLFRLRAPSIVGVTIFIADVLVVVFGRISWNQTTFAVFAAIVGAVMMVASWFILYRRDDLYRARDVLAARIAAFRRWK